MPIEKTITVDLQAEIEIKIVPAETDAEIDSVYVFIGGVSLQHTKRAQPHVNLAMGFLS